LNSHDIKAYLLYQDGHLFTRTKDTDPYDYVYDYTKLLVDINPNGAADYRIADMSSAAIDKSVVIAKTKRKTIRK
jgi:hypothetical protein